MRTIVLPTNRKERFTLEPRHPWRNKTMLPIRELAERLIVTIGQKPRYWNMDYSLNPWSENHGWWESSYVIIQYPRIPSSYVVIQYPRIPSSYVIIQYPGIPSSDVIIQYPGIPSSYVTIQYPGIPSSYVIIQYPGIRSPGFLGQKGWGGVGQGRGGRGMEAACILINVGWPDITSFHGPTTFQGVEQACCWPSVHSFSSFIHLFALLLSQYIPLQSSGLIEGDR
jgi:hypothetical protein